MAYHYIQYFECVKIFLGVTKVMMWMKITLMIIKKMIFSTFWVCQSFLLSPSKRRQDLPLRLASQKESLVPGWFLVGWFIGWLVHWLVGWLVGQEKGCPCCLFGSWFVSLFPFLKTLKTGSQVREYAWLLVASGLVGLVLREVIEEQLESHWLQLFSSFFPRSTKLKEFAVLGALRLMETGPWKPIMVEAFAKFARIQCESILFNYVFVFVFVFAQIQYSSKKCDFFICNWEFRPLVLLKDQARLLPCQLFFPRLAEIIILLLLLLS